jgi:hypothetical protein
MFLDRDTVNFKPQWTYVHSISVALEHENNAGDSMVEINKLQLFNAPLKVLVPYPYLRQGPNSADSLLRRYAEAIQLADLFDDFSTLRRQLVIFGSKVNGNVVWRGFEYLEQAFVPVATS